MPAPRRGGRPATKSTVPIPNCAPRCRIGDWGTCWASAATAPSPPPSGTRRVDELAASLPRRDWRRVSAGTGAKGQRWYSWALLDIVDDAPGHHHLLIRRNDKTGELAYYRCYSPEPVTLADYVRVAGWRWKVEESFQTGKGLTGLDEHQVRTWTSWYRWITLAMLAHAFLVVTTAAERHAQVTNNTLITLTVNEFRHCSKHYCYGRYTRRRHPGLVPLAPKTPGQSPRQPPPKTRSTPMTSIYGCSTRADRPG